VTSSPGRPPPPANLGLIRRPRAPDLGARAAATPSWRFLRYAGDAFTTDGPGKIDARRQDDNWVVGIDGNETYLLPDALMHGG
jgi:hypothetical protein